MVRILGFEIAVMVRFVVFILLGMESMQKLSDALGVTLGYFFSPEEEKKETTVEMQQTMILMEELDPKMQNRVLGYVQSIAQLEKEKRED